MIDGWGVYLIFFDSDFVVYVFILYWFIDWSVWWYLYDLMEKNGMK